MKKKLKLALLAAGAVLLGAAAPLADLPLLPLTEADVGAEALKSAACYAHDGANVLLVAAERNAVVNSDGDLRLLQRSPDDGPLTGGARYIGSRFVVTISPSGDVMPDSQLAGRGHGRAEIQVSKAGKISSATARWNCRL